MKEVYICTASLMGKLFYDVYAMGENGILKTFEGYKEGIDQKKNVKDWIVQNNYILIS